MYEQWRRQVRKRKRIHFLNETEWADPEFLEWRFAEQALHVGSKRRNVKRAPHSFGFLMYAGSTKTTPGAKVAWDACRLKN